ncbi:MAG TPA: nitrogen fixation protein NifZ [Polyangiaceae bacterium]|nr:nitrogen fixation protein NifZ [Polyangiaceae bacterium]
MGLGKEEEIEVYGPPKFMPGAKVRSTKYVKNDGTYAGKEIGEVLVKKGAVGYVRDIGMYLQIYYIYAVEFIELGTVVGMRGRELERIEDAPVARSSQ